MQAIYPKLLATHLIVLGILFVSSTIQAQTNDTHLNAAIDDLYEADAHGQWFSFSIAALGAAPGLAVGTTHLSGQWGVQNTLAQSSSVLLIGASTGVLVHGLMRVYERQASAELTRSLYNISDHPENRRKLALLAMEDRATRSVHTRAVGGTLTILEGVGLIGLGSATLLDQQSSRGAGYALIGTGVLAALVGGIHFLGPTQSQRTLDATRTRLDLSP